MFGLRSSIQRRVDRLEHAQAARSWRSPKASVIAAVPIPDATSSPRPVGSRAA